MLHTLYLEARHYLASITVAELDAISAYVIGGQASWKPAVAAQ
jgi:hypothetical protein